MNALQGLSLDNQHHERNVVARDLDAGLDYSSDPRMGMAKKGSDYYAGSQPVEPSYASPRPSDKNNQFASDRPSLGRRIFRALARFFIAVLIGAGITLAWQSHGDDAKKMVMIWVPSLGSLLPDWTTKSPPDGQVSAASAATSPELVEQLKPMALNLAVVRHSLEQLIANQEQLAAKQEQITQNIATLQAVEQDIRQKISSPPPFRAAPRRTPPQPTAQSSAVQ